MLDREGIVHSRTARKMRSRWVGRFEILKGRRVPRFARFSCTEGLRVHEAVSLRIKALILSEVRSSSGRKGQKGVESRSAIGAGALRNVKRVEKQFRLDLRAGLRRALPLRGAMTKYPKAARAGGSTYSAKLLRKRQNWNTGRITIHHPPSTRGCNGSSGGSITQLCDVYSLGIPSRRIFRERPNSHNQGAPRYGPSTTMILPTS